MIDARTKVCVIIGSPIEHSLSPQMHNAAYKALGINSEYVFIACQVEPKDLSSAIEGLRAMRVRGITCTIPHKVSVVTMLDHVEQTARDIGAVNTVVNDSGKLKGYNTDWLGIVTPLERRIKLKGKTVAVIGAGGAARAAVFGLRKKGANVLIYNRTKSKADILAKASNAQAKTMNEIEKIKEVDVIINTTPLGMKEHPASPIPKSVIQPHHIVFDIVYNPHQTMLLAYAKEKGAQTIHGYEMLLYQGTAQFEHYTGKKAPVEVMEETLKKQLNA